MWSPTLKRSVRGLLNRSIVVMEASHDGSYNYTVQRHEQRCWWNGAIGKLNIIIIKYTHVDCSTATYTCIYKHTDCVRVSNLNYVKEQNRQISS